MTVQELAFKLAQQFYVQGVEKFSLAEFQVPIQQALEKVAEENFEKGFNAAWTAKE